jgi:hypothetical protein
MVVILVLGKPGDIVEHDKNIKFSLGDEISLTSLKGVVNNKGKGKLTRQFIWEENGININLYGYSQGTRDQINIHKLPKPMDKATLYGDMVIIATNTKNTIVDYAESSYYEFFTNNTYETRSNVDDEDEDGFIVDDSSDSDSETDNEQTLEDTLDDMADDTIDYHNDHAIIKNELQLESEYL